MSAGAAAAFSPRSLEEALELRAAHPEATPVAGGTDVMVAVNAGLRPRALLDLSHVAELEAWQRDGDRVTLGAAVTFARLARELPVATALAEAARSVASPQVRARATVGGNLATASPAGDGIAVLAAYGADVLLAAAGGGRRRVPLPAFLLGPKRTALAADELITGVEWRVASGPGSFAKVGRRGAMVIAVASACLQVDEDAGEVRLALGSVAPTVVRAHEAEALGAALLADGLRPDGVADFGRLAAAAVSPIDDLRGTAAYRRLAVEVLARRALLRALEERRN